MPQEFLPLYKEAEAIKDYTVISDEELLTKNRELNIWLIDPFLTDRQRTEIKRIQNHIVLEVNERINEGRLKSVLGKIAIA
jgi:hypothetical protein